MKPLLKYFLQGLLLFIPLAITIAIIVGILIGLGELFNRLGLRIHPVVDPILGFIILIFVIVIVGYLSSTIIFQPIFSSLEKLMGRTPLIKILYTSLKDLTSAFVSGKKSFNQPVLVVINKDIDLYKLGFITQEDLSVLGLQEKVAVYLPHSYNFSGNMFIVASKNVTILEDVSSTEVMKFIVSGGITQIGPVKKIKKKHS